MIMSKKQKPQPEVLEEYIRIKDEFKEQYSRKKQTQRDAKRRREYIRELKENREWD
jgi:hypothetical protein